MGSILELAKRDAKRFVKSGGFEVSIEMITPSNDKRLLLTGLGTKHWINFDSDGNPINSKNVHVTIDEDFLKANKYPSRNAKGDVYLKGHLVSFADSTGFKKDYVVREWLPDEVLGLIVLILGDYTK